LLADLFQKDENFSVDYICKPFGEFGEFQAFFKNKFIYFVGEDMHVQRLSISCCKKLIIKHFHPVFGANS
jgi:hypothetical protein